jgi:alpha-ketoglutarate-dependent 2,4-dichlorophenoxyacetate dioxygenase
MSVSIRLISACPDFVGEVAGIDLSQPARQEDIEAVETGMLRLGVLVFREQMLNDSQQIRFTTNFGPLEQNRPSNIKMHYPLQRRIAAYLHRTDKIARLRQKLVRQRPDPTAKQIQNISNTDGAQRTLPRDHPARLFQLRNQLWHTDSSFKPVPAKYSLLYARAIPERGGNTEFADMRAAYDALDDESKSQIAGLICQHSEIYSRDALGFEDFDPDDRVKWGKPVSQPLVRRHPVTGRYSLFLSSHAGAIVGWPNPEARVLLRDLIEHATQRKYVYSHSWRQGDLVMWDNRVTMHRGRRYDNNHMRVLHRTTVAG